VGGREEALRSLQDAFDGRGRHGDRGTRQLLGLQSVSLMF